MRIYFSTSKYFKIEFLVKTYLPFTIFVLQCALSAFIVHEFSRNMNEYKMNVMNPINSIKPIHTHKLPTELVEAVDDCFLIFGTLSWCSGKRTGVTLLLAGQAWSLSSRKRERGEVGAGVVARLEEPSERWEGRRLPMELSVSPHLAPSLSRLALVSTMLGLLPD